jgi:hypothetical protein
MIIPKRNVGPFARELIEECLVSRETRKDAARFWRKLYLEGSVDGVASKHNLCYSHVDKLSSLLFSPSEVRFTVAFDADETAEWSSPADVTSRYINRQFARRNCDLAFAQALDLALTDGCSILKTTWGHSGYQPHVIKQQFFGVLREDMADLDDQDAFCHSYYLTPAQFRRLLGNHPRKAEILARVVSSHSEESVSDVADDSYFHEIVSGGLQPVGNQQSQSSVGVFGSGTPMLSPNVAAKLIRVDDLWVMNDEADNGSGDWNTLRLVGDIVIEGDLMLRNLGDVPGEHPFVKVCVNETPGYFWGRSELAAVASLQTLLNARMNNVDDIFSLQARPPRSFVGFSGITPEKMRALLTRGGTFTDDSPTGQIQSHAPDMPANALEYLAVIERNFDDVGGMTAVMSGQGESGVRSQNHASTLLRTSSPRIRDRAIIAEKQISSFGDLCFKMSRAKEAKVFTAEGGRDFLLSQLPEDAAVTVDSHTSSPAFSGDNMQLAFALAKAGAIDGESLIELTQPPHRDSLILKYREREKAKQKFLEQHPELLQKGGSHKK